MLFSVTIAEQLEIKVTGDDRLVELEFPPRSHDQVRRCGWSSRLGSMRVVRANEPLIKLVTRTNRWRSLLKADYTHRARYLGANFEDVFQLAERTDI